MTVLLTKMLGTFLVVAVTMIVLWLISLWRRDASVVDPFWGTGFVIVACYVLITTPAAQNVARCLLLTTLTTIWGLRLSAYLLWRNLGHGEDRRYKAMRDHHGTRFWWVSLFTVFLLQGVILWIVSMPIQVTMFRAQTATLGWIDFVGVSVWGIGLLFEAVGDWQMAKFQANPGNSGRVMDRGLWSWTRHPNYFGDFCIWWGLYLIATSGGAGWTVFSPLLMSLFLFKVSGVTLLEKTITTRRPDYAAYQAKTSSFFPWWPKI